MYTVPRTDSFNAHQVFEQFKDHILLLAESKCQNFSDFVLCCSCKSASHIKGLTFKVYL